mmetsp:Transcript_5894/g.12938  ORF Transcript_5894/g.12938 Transcript_5894/m.12938 type:complete len:139 (+) Transcript_5894:15-431(+)
MGVVRDRNRMPRSGDDDDKATKSNPAAAPAVPAAYSDGSRAASRELRDRFTKDEDEFIKRAVLRNNDNDDSGDGGPFADWRGLAEILPWRTGTQIRERWANYLNPLLNRQPFSREYVRASSKWTASRCHLFSTKNHAR